MVSQLTQNMNGVELASAMRVSKALVSRWAKEGCPCVYIGKVKSSRRGARPRYDLDKVKAWLEEQSKQVSEG